MEQSKSNWALLFSPSHYESGTHPWHIDYLENQIKGIQRTIIDKKFEIDWQIVGVVLNETEEDAHAKLEFLIEDLKAQMAGEANSTIKH